MPMPVKMTPTEIPAVTVVETGMVKDDRGFFSETYSSVMFGRAGLDAVFVQDNLSSSRKGTLRGLHYQLEPHAMGKLVRVVRGSAFDVAVDIRRGSPTFGKWVGRTLTAENRHALWVPAGFAHGFLALEDETFVFYKCTQIHTPESERAIHFRRSGNRDRVAHSRDPRGAEGRRRAAARARGTQFRLLGKVPASGASPPKAAGERSRSRGGKAGKAPLRARARRRRRGSGCEASRGGQDPLASTSPPKAAGERSRSEPRGSRAPVSWLASHPGAAYVARATVPDVTRFTAPVSSRRSSAPSSSMPAPVPAWSPTIRRSPKSAS